MRREEEWGYVRYDMRFDPLFWFKVSLSEKTPSWPLGGLHWEKIEREHVSDDVQCDIPTLEDLGITLRTIEQQMPWELRPWIWGIYRGLDADAPQTPPAPPKTVWS